MESIVLKNCKVCNIQKSLDEFHPKHARCKSCYNEWQNNKRKSNPELMRSYYERHKNSESYLKGLESNRKYYEKHKDILLKKNKEWVNANKKRVLDNKKEYYLRNKKDIIEKKRLRDIERRKQDPSFRIKKNLRRRISLALELKGARKSSSTERLLGCSPSFLKTYLESKFKPGMTWENYGKWHIDHILPLSSFDLTIESEVLRACHYTNLQPLWAEENIRKSDDL